MAISYLAKIYTNRRKEMSGLSEVKVGDYVYGVTNAAQWSGPKVTHRLYKVTKLTNTQVVCDTLRFRKDTGVIIGKGYGGVSVATPEIVEQPRIEVSYRNRWIAAKKAFDELPKQALTTEQMEAMIEAYKKLTNPEN
jgi:predicted DNA binding protein